MILAHMDVAERYARLSTARRMKVGAIIVRDDRVISIGYNGTPPGEDNNCEVEPDNWDGDIRSLRTKGNVIHAEVNALTKLPVSSTHGSDMFCSHACCVPCAQEIVGDGIKTFFYRHTYRDSFGLEYLRDNGVMVRQIV